MGRPYRVHGKESLAAELRAESGPVLEDNPGLKNHRTVVLELAYEEYRMRLQAGEPLDAEEFSRQFPSLERSLYFYIAVDSLLGRRLISAGTQAA